MKALLLCRIWGIFMYWGSVTKFSGALKLCSWRSNLASSEACGNWVMKFNWGYNFIRSRLYLIRKSCVETCGTFTNPGT